MVPPGEERFWQAQNFLEDQVQKGFVVQLSLRQGIHDVLGSAEATSMSSSAKVTEAYNRVKLAASAASISDSFVDSAMTVRKRVLAVEMVHNSPLKSIYTIQAIVDWAKTSPGISITLDPIERHYSIFHFLSHYPYIGPH